MRATSVDDTHTSLKRRVARSTPTAMDDAINAMERQSPMSAEPSSTQPIATTKGNASSLVRVDASPVIRADSVILGGNRPGAVRVVFFTNPAHATRPAPHAFKRAAGG